MGKRKGKGRRYATAPACAGHHQPARTPAGMPITVPTYWTPEEALAVFDLVDDLREHIWTVYQIDLQKLIRRQRQSGSVDPIHIDEADLPF